MEIHGNQLKIMEIHKESIGNPWGSMEINLQSMQIHWKSKLKFFQSRDEASFTPQGKLHSPEDTARQQT